MTLWMWRGLTCTVILRGGACGVTDGPVTSNRTHWHWHHPLFWLSCTRFSRHYIWKPQEDGAGQMSSPWLCYNCLSHTPPNHWRRGQFFVRVDLWWLHCSKWETCRTFMNPDGTNSQWKAADRPASPTSCWQNFTVWAPVTSCVFKPHDSF